MKDKHIQVYGYDCFFMNFQWSNNIHLVSNFIVKLCNELQKNAVEWKESKQD